MQSASFCAGMHWVPGMMLLETGGNNLTSWNAFQHDHNFSGSLEAAVLLRNLLRGRRNGGLGDAAVQWKERVVDAVDEAVYSALEWIGMDIRHPSRITSELPFVRSPTPVVLAILSYLGIVFLWSLLIKRCGLKPRQQDPMPLVYLVVAHNLFLAILSTFMGVGIVLEAWKSGYSVWGNSYQDTEAKLGYYIYIFYVSKLYEFVDTGIMLLKRNLRQISYLHIYHHASISFVWWIVAYRFPGGDAYFSAAFNSWIHVVMYVYYLLAAVISKDEVKRRKYLFWGKYLTMLQIFQFVSFIGQAIFGMGWPGSYPAGMCRFLFFYSLSLLLFFSNFFLKKYSRPRRKSIHKSGKAE